MEIAFKLCLAFALIAATQLTPLEDHRKRSMEVMESCRKEFDIPEGPLPGLDEDSPKKFKCLVKCVLEGLYNKTISDIDNLHAEIQKRMRFLGLADEDFFIKEQGIFEKCKDMVSDECELAAKLMLCCENAVKKEGIKPKKS